MTRRKKLLGAIIVCALTIAGLTIWYTRPVAEAAILDPHPGLVAWWRFDEGTGTIAKDSSGNGNDGAVYGDATWVAGKYNNSLSFDGTNGYVETADIDLVEQITLDVWVKADDLSDKTAPRIAEKNVMTAWSLFVNSATYRVAFVALIGEASKAIESTHNLSDFEWHKITITYNGSHIEIYFDGVSDKTPIPATGNIGVNDQKIWIGKGVAAGREFRGIIDDVHIYNRALFADEILEDFQKGPDFSSRLRANMPKGTTQFIATLSWQGIGSMNATIESPSETYTEDMALVYQKTVYSSSSGDMLNIKRIAVSVTALVNDENWYITLEFDEVEEYKITVEVQK